MPAFHNWMLQIMNKDALADIQSEQPLNAIALDRVGVNGLCFALRLRDRAKGTQTVTAQATLGVNLPPQARGTHMSRFVEVLDAWQEELGCQSMGRLLEQLRQKLSASRAWAKFRFLYLMRKKSPCGDASADMAYKCSVSADLARRLSFTLGLEVPVMTVCPCSLAISSQGAHSQRAIVKMRVKTSRFVWLEEFIEIAEQAGSSPVYPLLKREDEKFVTETAFANPAFVEDVARAAASLLSACNQVEGFALKVESMESIHNHNAFAFVATPDMQP